MRALDYEVLQLIKQEDLHILMMNLSCQDPLGEVYQMETQIVFMIDLKIRNQSIEDFQVEKIIKKTIQMMKIFKGDHLELLYLSRL